MAAAKVKTLDEQKQDLIARGDLYRHAMAADLQQIQSAIGWLPKTFYLIKAASPLIIMGSPLIAWILRGKRKQKIGKNGEPAKDKASILGRIWGVIKIAQQVVPFVPVAIGTRGPRVQAPPRQLVAHLLQPRRVLPQPGHRDAMRGQQELVDLLLPVHGPIIQRVRSHCQL